jgi:alkylation response protein AidB-like acyl-CoA dehydrogenase
MPFALSAEQRELKENARSFLDETCSLDRVAELADSEAGWDPQSWRAFAELGWLGVTVAEEHGGAGLGWIEQALLLEELGYALYPGPYFSTVALALPALGPDARAEVAAGIRRWSAEVDGLVPDLPRVDRVVTDRGAADAAGSTLDSIDPTRPMGRLDATSMTPLPGGIDRKRVLVAVAAEAIGVAERALELAVAYAKDRRQFGRQIGAFQAVAHPLAESFADIELARSLTYAAAWKLDEAPDEAGLAAASAKALAGEAAVTVCRRAIQVHGGIGFTWEHPLHRFYKRAVWLNAFGGHPALHRAALAQSLLAS